MTTKESMKVVSFDDVRNFLQALSLSATDKPAIDAWAMPIRVTVKLDGKSNEIISGYKTYPMLAFNASSTTGGLVGLLETFGLFQPRGNVFNIVNNVKHFCDQPFKGNGKITRLETIDGNGKLLLAGDVYMLVHNVKLGDGNNQVLPAHMWVDNVHNLYNLSFIGAVSTVIASKPNKQASVIADTLLVVDD